MGTFYRYCETDAFLNDIITIYTKESQPCMLDILVKLNNNLLIR